jgi:hypothetical protein
MDRRIMAELSIRLESELPDAGERISRRFGDETFHDMCSEYEQCVISLRRWSQAPAEHTAQIEEYSTLVAELHREILSYLQELGP